ncbi:hypothetical protein HYH02_005176 [Chlamydomonas schloesseri]|uniref:Uncharacterized protein n=1 Tax=Chlamydomonas schloesseri TaxID=2026947 RepID=A0A835WLY5_9CHLO|nr:hypothetical protein HYH02_005176 [Chlamydomonas schloesseri]|eukprot:KAG2449644.1 hypothetical protein HYH02_005176 [Chlamydomonas schloesseri]
MSNQKQQEPDLLSTLRAISVDAVDALIDALRDWGCISRVRLACSGLREAVDGSLRKLGFYVFSCEDLEARLPSLERWPRVQELRYHVSDYDMLSSDIARAIEKFAVWAGGQPQASQHRVQVLRLDLSAACQAAPSPYLSATLAASLATWLPNIQELRISGCHMSVLPVQQPEHLRTMIAGGLGRLQQLQQLTLPGWSLLEALGEMQPRQGTVAADAAAGAAAGGGGWLRRLHELEIDAPEYDPITEAAAAGVASLRSLHVLQLSGSTAHSEATYGQNLLRLLEHVPPSLTRLSVSDMWNIPALTSGLELCFASGQLTEVTFPENSGNMTVEGLGAAAEDLLLPYLRARRAALPRLVVRCVQLPAVEDRGEDEAQQPPPQLASDDVLHAVRELLLRCEAFEVHEVLLRARTQLPTVAQAVTLLGMPQALGLFAVEFNHLVMRLRGASAASPGSEEGPAATGAGRALADADAAQRPQQQPHPHAGWPLLAAVPAAPQALVSRAVQRLLAMPRVPPPSADQSAASWHAARLLVLRGPLVTGLAQVPKLVDEWVAWLAETATAAANSSELRVGDQALKESRWCGCWQLVPAALGGPALLVSCGYREGGAAALHAALRSVEPGAQLEAVWVAVQRYPGYRSHVLQPLLWCVQQEIDDACAACAGSQGSGLGLQSLGAEGDGGVEGGPGAERAPASHPEALAKLLELAKWLQQMGKCLMEELPACKEYS